jgi:two-component system sensor histidine kinase BaeS
VNRIGVRLAMAMLLVAVVSLIAVPLATTVAERAAYRRLPDALRTRVEAFSRPDPLLSALRDRLARPDLRRRAPGMTIAPDGRVTPSFEGEAARLAILVRDLRALRRDAVVGGVAIAIAASVALAWALSRSLARPIEAVSRAAGRVAAGDLTARAEVPSLARQPAEVRGLAHDFDAMAASLQRLEAERTSMIADVAHELRTPLATLSLRLEAATEGVLQVDAEEAATLLAQTRLLSRLVDDLRTLSLAEAGRLTLTPERLDLRDPVRAAVAAHAPAARRRNVALRAELPTDPLPVEADGDRLLQVLHNLLENALRVSPDGGEVVVLATDRGGRAHVTVRDGGPGFAVDPPEAIFERFERDRRRDTRGGSGSGLGLAIVRTLVELHGGDVVARRIGEATEVGFRLPRARG